MLLKVRVQGDVLSEELPQRLDVLDGGPEGVHLARLVLQVRDVLAERRKAAVHLLHAVPLPRVPPRHRRGLEV